MSRVVPIDTTPTNGARARLIAALSAADGSTRLKAALAIGSNAEPGLVDTLMARCAIEPDFYVRDMLTWALTRLPVLLRAMASDDPGIRAHASATERRLHDPHSGFDLAVQQAKRIFVLGK